MPANQSTPEVTRADREAARAIYVTEHVIDGIDPFLSGENDAGTLVQAFARHRLAYSPARGGDELREALQASLEFACLTLAFHGRDRGTDRQERMLDDLEELARKLDPQMRKALASTDMAGAEKLAQDSETLAAQATSTSEAEQLRAYARGIRRGAALSAPPVEGLTSGEVTPCHPLWNAAIMAHDATPHLVGCHGKVSDTVHGWQPCSCYRHIRAMIGFAASLGTHAGLTSGGGINQADRDAAADILDLLSGYAMDAAHIRSGDLDHNEVLRRVARHRLAASPKATATAIVQEEAVARVTAAWSVMMRKFGGAFGDIDNGYFPEVEEMRRSVASLTDSGTAATIGGERA